MKKGLLEKSVFCEKWKVEETQLYSNAKRNFYIKKINGTVYIDEKYLIFRTIRYFKMQEYCQNFLYLLEPFTSEKETVDTISKYFDLTTNEKISLREYVTRSLFEEFSVRDRMFKLNRGKRLAILYVYFKRLERAIQKEKSKRFSVEKALEKLYGE